MRQYGGSTGSRQDDTVAGRLTKSDCHCVRHLCLFWRVAGNNQRNVTFDGGARRLNNVIIRRHRDAFTRAAHPRCRGCGDHRATTAVFRASFWYFIGLIAFRRQQLRRLAPTGVLQIVRRACCTREVISSFGRGRHNNEISARRWPPCPPARLQPHRSRALEQRTAHGFRQ